MTGPSSPISAGQVAAEEAAQVITVLSAGDPVATEKEATRNTGDLSHAIKILTRVVLLFCFLVVVIGGGNFMQIKGQNDNAEISQKSITENTERIKDCTDPAGECFKQAQLRTGRVIASISDAQVAAVACAQEAAVTSAVGLAKRNAALAACVKTVLTTPK